MEMSSGANENEDFSEKIVIEGGEFEHGNFTEKTNTTSVKLTDHTSTTVHYGSGERLFECTESVAGGRSTVLKSDSSGDNLEMLKRMQEDGELAVRRIHCSAADNLRKVLSDAPSQSSTSTGVQSNKVTVNSASISNNAAASGEQSRRSDDTVATESRDSSVATVIVQGGTYNQPQFGPTTNQQNIEATITQNITVHHHPCHDVSQSTKECERYDDKLQRVLKRINESTWKNTHVKVGETLHRDELTQPDFEVHPQMTVSPHFNKGGHHGGHGEGSMFRLMEETKEYVQYQSVTSKHQRLRNKRVVVKKMEYQKDRRFNFKDYDNAIWRPLSVESMMMKINEKKDKLDVLGVLAQAGSGKTTCMRRWARRAIQNSGMTEQNEYSPSEESRFQMVYFMEMKYIEYRESTTLQDILFKHLFEDDEDRRIAFDWLVRNEDKALVILDGLDQAPWTITEDYIQSIDPYQKASTTTLFANLLSRSLFPGTRFVLASREIAAAKLPDEMFTNDVITLTGFSEADARKLFNVITADEYDITDSDSDDTENVHMDSWDKLLKTSSVLVPFLSIPAFLMFTAVVFKTHGISHSTVTELIANVIDTLQYSTVMQERKRIGEIIHRLKRLSYIGMERGLVIFSESDLKDCGLKASDVQDLLIMVPRSRSLRHELVEGNNVLFFCHQILQEFLAACFITEMNCPAFREFVATKLNKDKWSVVRRFVCGLTFAASTNMKLLKIIKKSDKQVVLRKSIALQLKMTERKQEDALPTFGIPEWDTLGKYELLEMYAVILESNDNELIHLITTIKLVELPLGRDAGYMISSLMTKIESFDMLRISKCRLSNELLNIMAGNMKSSKVKIRTVEFSHLDYVTFTALNNFLQNICSENITIEHPYILPISEGPNWKNIQQLTINGPSHSSWPFCIIMTSLSDVVSVVLVWKHLMEPTADYYGIFNKSSKIFDVDATLKDSCRLIYYLSYATHYLKPSRVSFNWEQEFQAQFIEWGFLKSLTTWETDAKINEIVLDYRPQSAHEVNVLCSDTYRWECEISALVQQFQVKVLNILIHVELLGIIPNGLERAINLLGCELRIHVTEIWDSRKALSDLQRYKVKYLRLGVLRHISIQMDDLVSFIKDLKTTKEVRICVARPGIIKGFPDDDKDRLREAAAFSRIYLTFENMAQVSPRHSPWNVNWKLMNYSLCSSLP